VLLAETDPDRHLASGQLDLLALWGQPGEKITPALIAPERAQRLQQVGRQCLCLYQALSDSLDQTPLLTPDQQLPLRLLLAYLHKILTDETTVTLSQPDQPQTPPWLNVRTGQRVLPGRFSQRFDAHLPNTMRTKRLSSVSTPPP
jgi:hypothetical protein